MFANIKDNNVRIWKLRTIGDEYWDFMLFKGECYGDGVYGDMSNECLAAHIDLGTEGCYTDGKLYSSVMWQDAVCKDVEMKNIGFTGVDNGFISYDKFDITKKEFVEKFLHSKYKIEDGDLRFFLSPVSDNTLRHSYDYEYVESGDSSYMALNGGFFQGFFKLYGYDYQVLPSTVDSDWHFEFTIRKRSDYLSAENAVNKAHPENAGIFFYIGARAENKFNEIYNGTATNDNFKANDYEIGDYIFDEYFSKDDDIDLSKVDITTSNDHPADEQGYYEFETDNKYTFFNCTKTGFTVNTWEGENVLFQGQHRTYIDNPFLLYNCTKTGHTVRDYEEITVPGMFADSAMTVSVTRGLVNNAFALRVTEDGAVEYRYTTCNPDGSGMATISERSFSGLVKDDEWATINLRVGRTGKDTMRLYIYVDGYLVLISKELTMFNFRAFDEVADKQEAVPYNISLGGGTQGLMDRVWLNYMDFQKNVYELEKNYAGTFIGDFKSFKMYGCAMSLGQIRSNNIYEKSFII